MTRKLLPEKLDSLLGKTSGERLESALFNATMRLAGSVGIERASKVGGALLSAFGPFTRKHHHVKRNMDIVLAHRPEHEKKTAIKEVWRTLGCVMAELPHMAEVVEASKSQRLWVCAESDLSPYINGERSAVFVAPHLGNWEVSAAVGHAFNIPLSVVYSAISNPRIDERLQQLRQALRCNFIEKSGAARAMVRELKAKRSLGLVMDQRADEGVEMPFFNKAAVVPIAAIALACRFDADIIPAKMVRLPGSRFQLTLKAPLRPTREDLTGEALTLDLTRQVFSGFETWIAENPGQWLCVKRRWPKDHKQDKLKGSLQRQQVQS